MTRPPRCLRWCRDHRRRKAVGFQHLDDANVRETLGCATAQGDADADGERRRKEQAASRVGPGGGGAATSSQGQGCQHGHGGNAGQRVKKAVKRMPGDPAEQRGAKYSGGVDPTPWVALFAPENVAASALWISAGIFAEF